jgi:hypothetical protein
MGFEVQEQEELIMFGQVFEGVRRVTEFNVRTQQRLFKNWTSLFGMPAVPNGAGEQIANAQKEWTDFATGLVKKQRETLEPYFKDSLQILEEACCLVEIKDPEEFRTKATEIWQKAFQSVRHLCETEIYDFETALAKWFELVSKVSVPVIGPIPGVEKPAA